MIISHENRFIFIKTAKTAGTSLEIALSRYCGPDDIITPISETDEKVRQKLGYRGPQHYLKPRDAYTLSDHWRSLKKQRPVERFYNHIPASEVVQHVPESVWRNYFKFAVVRNPYDRAVSRFFWRHTRKNKGLSKEDFRKFLFANPEALARNREKTKVGGAIDMDFMVRYERFEEDLAVVSERIGLPSNLYDDINNLSAKKGHRPKNTTAQELFEGFEDGVALVERVCADDIRDFGYTPPVARGDTTK